MTPLEKLQRYLGEGRKLREATPYTAVDVANAQKDAYTRVAVLEEACRVMAEALEDVGAFCLCERFETKGFDYGETHPAKGKPGIGKRRLTPTDLANRALDRVAAMLPEGEVK